MFFSQMRPGIKALKRLMADLFPVRSGSHRVTLALILLGVFSIRASGGVGTRTGTILRDAVTAEQVGSGDALYAERGVRALWRNPAASVGVSGKEVLFSYQERLSDVRSEYLGVVVPLSGWQFGVQGYFRDLGTQQGRDAFGNATGQFSNKDAVLGIVMGKSLGSTAIGVGIKGVQMRLAGVKATGYVGEVGLIQRLGNRFALGATILNLGPPVRFIEEEEDLPLTLRLGWSAEIWPDRLKWQAGVEQVWGEGDAFTMGLGWRLNEIVKLRLGYRSDIDIGPGISGGFDLHLHRLIFGYGYRPTDEFGATHHLSITFHP